MKMNVELEMTKKDIVVSLAMGALMIFFLGCAYSCAAKKKKKEKENKQIVP